MNKRAESMGMTLLQRLELYSRPEFYREVFSPTENGEKARQAMLEAYSLIATLKESPLQKR